VRSSREIECLFQRSGLAACIDATVGATVPCSCSLFALENRQDGMLPDSLYSVEAHGDVSLRLRASFGRISHSTLYPVSELPPVNCARDRIIKQGFVPRAVKKLQQDS